MQDIAFDSHKHYTLASVEPATGGPAREARIPYERGVWQAFLQGCDQGSPVAVETIERWYWSVEEMEAAGMVPRLVHARKAKLMMGMLNKTDKRDARGGESSPAHGHPADRVDSAWGLARPARPAADADGAGAAADTTEASDSRDAGQVGGERP